MQYDLDLEDINDGIIENVLFEDFGDKHIVNALRVVTTKIVTPLDNEMVYDAMCIIVAMYMNKVQNGEINQNRTMH